MINYIGSFALIVFGVVLLATSRKTDSMRIIIGLLLAVGVPIFLAVDETYKSSVEWNPILSKSAVSGTYADRQRTLTLNPDATYNLQSNEGITTGIWTLDDFNLTLGDSTKGTTVSARVITYKNHPYVMLEQPDDLDNWNRKLGLRQIENIQ
jgi:hypothetical protein